MMPSQNNVPQPRWTVDSIGLKHLKCGMLGERGTGDATIERNAFRVLALVCSMTGGDSNKYVSRDDVIKKARDIGLLTMPDESFTEWLSLVIKCAGQETEAN